MSALPSERVLRRTFDDMATFAEYWHGEIPTKIHSRLNDDGGYPQWHPSFARWMLSADASDQRWASNPEPRLKTTRAFRKLRQTNAREYEILYRVCILGDTVTNTAKWATARAIRLNKPERYTEADILWLLVSATDKVANAFSA